MRTATQRRARMLPRLSGGRAPRRWDDVVLLVTACTAAVLLAALTIAQGVLWAAHHHGAAPTECVGSAARVSPIPHRAIAGTPRRF